jgi:hypothetical protein
MFKLFLMGCSLILIFLVLAPNTLMVLRGANNMLNTCSPAKSYSRIEYYTGHKISVSIGCWLGEEIK